MAFQFPFKLTGACALLAVAAVAGAATPHHGGGHAHKPPAAAQKEQKPWGIAGEAKSVTRTVALTMDDNMRFTPDKLSFKQGETVRFVIRNQGKLLHELVIGTKAELEAHAAMMAKSPGMAHDLPGMTHVPAGKSGELVWTFNRPGEFDFACLVAGHYQAGMVGKINVTAR
ncbi:plastocyanin/azurin family copper-binding protein [Polaromonas sp. YR568]|uniref:cupredoxin domain-containing protein n=1 Tax=Polaromonas sp. YR568 TaxID=1855301 RepID=UPI00398C1BCC